VTDFEVSSGRGPAPRRSGTPKPPTDEIFASVAGQPGTLVLISCVKTVYEKNKSIPPGRAFGLILLALSGKSGLVTAYLLRCLNFVTTF
jgi:hypothetical protein